MIPRFSGRKTYCARRFVCLVRKPEEGPKELFQIFPSAEYMTEIEYCRELPGGVVELTVRWKEDLPNFDDETSPDD
jgi:hypothetical protein